jgi:Domain of unknown function (DUF4349)
MEPNRDDQLIADLRALRPTPRPRFAAELDERVAAGFPRRSPLPWAAAWHRLFAGLTLRQTLIPAGGVAIAVIALATALVAIDGGSSDEPRALFSSAEPEQRLSAPSTAKPKKEVESSGGEAGTASNEQWDGVQFEPEVAPAPSSSAAAVAGGAKNLDGSGSYTSSSAGLHHRAVERSAQITLAADPMDVADDAAAVFEAVHAHNGIVMRSSTEEGRPGEAGATFDLLIPSAKLDDAMAAFSEIDAVRSRHEATADITAPTVTAGELLQESKARVDSLLAQLEEAETESEREAVEAELRQERRHRAALRSRLAHLERRADYSRVSLRIETGGGNESSGGGTWGIGDALDDAGHVLTVAAAVTLIALAVLGPIALIALLAWLTQRAWVRRERRRVLS